MIMWMSNPVKNYFTKVLKVSVNHIPIYNSVN